MQKLSKMETHLYLQQARTDDSKTIIKHHGLLTRGLTSGGRIPSKVHGQTCRVLTDCCCKAGKTEKSKVSDVTKSREEVKAVTDMVCIILSGGCTNLVLFLL